MLEIQTQFLGLESDWVPVPPSHTQVQTVLNGLASSPLVSLQRASAFYLTDAYVLFSEARFPSPFLPLSKWWDLQHQSECLMTFLVISGLICYGTKHLACHLAFYLKESGLWGLTLVINLSHLGRENLNRKIASIRLACGHVYEDFLSFYKGCLVGLVFWESCMWAPCLHRFPRALPVTLPPSKFMVSTLVTIVVYIDIHYIYYM